MANAVVIVCLVSWAGFGGRGTLCDVARDQGSASPSLGAARRMGYFPTEKCTHKNGNLV